MKKSIRLTESDLTKIIQKIIVENEVKSNTTSEMDPLVSDFISGVEGTGVKFQKINEKEVKVMFDWGPIFHLKKIK